MGFGAGRDESSWQETTTLIGPWLIVYRVRWADTLTHVKDRLLDVTHRKCEVVVKEVEHTQN